jgi:RimJ/RimL family protein N-acetyltransferase
MLKTVIIQLNKLNMNQPQSYRRIYGFETMLKDLEENNVKINELILSNESTALYNAKSQKEKIQEIKNKIESITANLYQVEECLIISDLSCVVAASKLLQIPCVGYDNKTIPKQDLFQANILIEGFEEVNYAFLTDVYKRFHHEPITIAVTSRLIIREMILEDLDELYELYSHPAVTQFLEPLYDRPEEIEFTKAYIKNMYGFYGYGLWSLIDKTTGRLIGRAGLNNREVDGEIQIEMGYMIGAAYQRQGYALEACSQILEFAVTKLDCKQVNCFIDNENEASIALVKKLGFLYQQMVEIGQDQLSWYRWTYKE